MDQREYERQELENYNAMILRAERAGLDERGEARREWAEALQDAELIAERVNWMIGGSYGYGAYIRARDIARRPRMNRAARLGIMIAALEWGCPGAFARSAFTALSADQQAAVTAAINREIKHFLDEEKAKAVTA